MRATEALGKSNALITTSVSHTILLTYLLDDATKLAARCMKTNLWAVKNSLAMMQMTQEYNVYVII